MSKAEENIARELLRQAHIHVRSVLQRIDTSIAEVQRHERTFDALRAEVQKETSAWIVEHPAEARAIAKLFAL